MSFLTLNPNTTSSDGFESSSSSLSEHRFQALESIIVDILDGNIPSLSLKMEFFRNLPKALSSDDLKFKIFLNAISKGIQAIKPEISNLYLEDFGNSQIDLFTLIAKKLPYITLTENLVNQYLFHKIQDTDNAVIIDIGIGKGRQIFALLNYMWKFEKLPKQITIVGIDLSESMLKEVGTRLAEFSTLMGIPIRFIPLVKAIEQLSSQDWQIIRELGNGILVNASFSFHHIGTQAKCGIDMKNVILERLKCLNPMGLILTEPNSNHETSHLKERLHNAWKHFGLVFDTVDQLHLTTHEKIAIKQFFSREIEDILGNEEHLRSERHETAEMWLERLKKFGFAYDSTLLEMTKNSIQWGISVSRRNEYVTLDFKGEPVVSLIAVR